MDRVSSGASLFLGSVVADFKAELQPPDIGRFYSATAPSKLDSEIHLAVGGAVANAARTYKKVTGDSPLVVPILGEDALGQVVGKELDGEFDVRCVGAAESTRVSFILPRVGDDRRTTAITSRPRIDYDAVFEGVAPYLHRARTLFLGSFDADATRFLLRVLDRFRGASYLMLTRSQLRSPSALGELLPRVDYAQMNRAEASEVVEGGSLLQGIRRLRSGGRTTMVVTAGPLGVDAIGPTAVQHADSLDVEVVDDLGCGDSVGGAVCVGLAESKSLDETLCCAMAVAAKKVSLADSYGTWDELLAYYRQTRHIPSSPGIAS